MEEVFGFVDAIVFAEAENGFAVVKVKEPKKREVTCIVGILPGIRPGESIRCQGVWKHHPKFGQQFEVKSFQTEAPTDVVGIQRYLESGMIRGIGPAYAERIVKKYGVETLKILDEAPHKLLSVPGIGEKKIESIIKCWAEQREVRNVMIFLRGHGVTPSFAQKIYKTYGDESIAKMAIITATRTPIVTQKCGIFPGIPRTAIVRRGNRPPTISSSTGLNCGITNKNRNVKIIKASPRTIVG